MPALQETTTQGVDSTTLLAALTALKKGDFSVRLPQEWTGMAGKVADTFNDVVEMHDRMAHELKRVSQVVGREGKLAQQAALSGARGSWSQAVDSVNSLID